MTHKYANLENVIAILIGAIMSNLNLEIRNLIHAFEMLQISNKSVKSSRYYNLELIIDRAGLPS